MKEACWPVLLIYENEYSYFAAKSEEELRRTKKEFEDMKKDKDQTIAELKFKIEHMESVYESILHVSIVQLSNDSIQNSCQCYNKYC